MSEPLDLFASTAPGLEAVCAAELRALGIEARAEAGGVAWRGDTASLRRANLWLRTASRVLVRIATFRARSFIELERHARRIPWQQWATAGQPVRLRVTSRKSRLYHQGAIAERLANFIADRVEGVGAGTLERGDDEGEESAAGGQLFVVRVVRDEFVINADSSGALLHLRGYRQALAKAPLRETLGAAMLLAAGAGDGVPVIDPMCGSGTLPIEAALLGANVAPGLASRERTPRAYAFTHWPTHDASAWERDVQAAREAVRPPAAPVRGSDRDAGAITAARANAERAGVEAWVELEQRPLSAIEPLRGEGLLIANPPYGVRVGESDALRSLYAALGRTARDRFPGWRVALLSADRVLEGQVGIAFEELFRTSNGGIPVRLVMGRARDGSR